LGEKKLKLYKNIQNKKGEADNYEFYDEEGVLLEGPLLETRFIKKRNQLTQLMVIMKRRNQASIIINKPETEKKGNRDENQGLQNNIDPYKNFDTLLPKLKVKIAL